MDLQTHTLIIGGGPSGATLARELSKKGINNILIEKNLNFDKPCGGGIKSQVYEEFDLPKSLETKRVNTIHICGKDSKSIVSIEKSPLTIVLRKEFDAKLRELAKNDGSEVIEGKFITAHYFNDHVISTIKLKEKTIQIKSKYLVGADGVQSSVKKDLLNTKPNAILTNYTLLDGIDYDVCELHFGKTVSKDYYAWVFPHGKKLSIGSVLVDKASKDYFKKLNDEYNTDNKKLKTKGYFIPMWKEKNIFYKDQVFFVGDSAQQVLPLTAEGIYYAMKSARILSNAIAKEQPELYEKEWKEALNKRFKFFLIMQKIFLSNDFFVNKMISFFNNDKIRESGIGYLAGEKKPLTIGSFLMKLPKLLLKNR